MNPVLDWHGVLSGQPLQWIISGFLTTVWVSVAGIILATVLAVVLLALLGLSFAVRPMRRRRVHSARAYRPMRDRTLNDTAFQSRAHSTL